jgi:hypothetical protein
MPSTCFSGITILMSTSCMESCTPNLVAAHTAASAPGNLHTRRPSYKMSLRACDGASLEKITEVRAVFNRRKLTRVNALD